MAVEGCTVHMSVMPVPPEMGWQKAKAWALPPSVRLQLCEATCAVPLELPPLLPLVLPLVLPEPVVLALPLLPLLAAAAERVTLELPSLSCCRGVPPGEMGPAAKIRLVAAPEAIWAALRVTCRNKEGEIR